MIQKQIALSLGGNIGNVEDNFRNAVRTLRNLGFGNLQISPFFKTTAVDCPEGSPDFHNAALTATCTLEPLALLDLCKKLESAAGRPALYERNSPRQLDLDIILYADLMFLDERLQIPHPRATERRFVLEPLATIAPNWIFPNTGLTVKQHLERLP